MEREEEACEEEEDMATAVALSGTRSLPSQMSSVLVQSSRVQSSRSLCPVTLLLQPSAVAVNVSMFPTSSI